MGWINLVFIAAIAAAIAVPMYAKHQSPSAADWAVFVFAFILSLLYLFVGAGIKQFKPWARIVGVILSLAALFNFPVGTLIGIVILYYLIRGWNEIASVA
jgi:hypothetical protein